MSTVQQAPTTSSPYSVDLSGKTAVVTGARGGIGRAISELFPANGAHVVGMSTVQEVLASVQMGLKVACLSFVTNMAGGVGQPLSHADVIDLVAQHRATLHQLIEKAVGVAP